MVVGQVGLPYLPTTANTYDTWEHSAMQVLIWTYGKVLNLEKPQEAKIYNYIYNSISKTKL